MNRNTKELSVFKLNMQMFVDGFVSRGYDPIFYGGQYDRVKLNNVMLYYGQDNLDEQVLYVCSEATYLKKPIHNQDICFILCGSAESCEMDIIQPIIYFQCCEYSEILNIALEIQHRLYDIFSRMQMAVQIGGLNTLANLGVELFNNPLTIHDEKFFVLSRPRNILGMSEILQDSSTGIATFRVELIDHLKNDPDYLKTLTTHGSHLWIHHSRTPYRVMYINLFDENKRYRGRILLNEINAIFEPSYFRLLEYFAEYVLMLLKDYQRDSSDNYVMFDSFLAKYLSGDHPNQDTAIKVLSYNFWQREDCYLCCCVEVQTANMDSSYDVVLTELAITFPQARIFQDGSLVWLVINLSQANVSENEFQTAIEKFSLSGPYLIGESSLFHDFFRISHAYKQAKMALEYGKEVLETQNLYVFQKISVSYMFMKLRSCIPAESFCCEELFRIIEHDESKGTDYYETIKVYLEHERDLAKVSSLLHIHRSTLTYRIGKIQEIVNLSLDDPENRFYLLTCIHILENGY